MTYLTDSYYLYEVVGRNRNYGLCDGEILLVRDCRSGVTREMGVLEQNLCESVKRRVA